MKSKIYLKEIVDNKDRKFGSALEYYPSRIEDEDGKILNALFTKSELEKAIKRADINLEDIPEIGFFEGLFD